MLLMSSSLYTKSGVKKTRKTPNGYAWVRIMHGFEYMGSNIASPVYEYREKNLSAAGL